MAIPLEVLEGLFHRDKLQIEVPQLPGIVLGEIGAEEVATLAPTSLSELVTVEPIVEGSLFFGQIDFDQTPGGRGFLARGVELHQERLACEGPQPPKESFGLALIEAMACGTTCVVNGDYRGFAELDLRPNVYGNITGKRGSVVDLADRALCDDVRIDAVRVGQEVRTTRDPSGPVTVYR